MNKTAHEDELAAEELEIASEQQIPAPIAEA